MRKPFLLALLVAPLAGCGSSSDESPAPKGSPPPVVTSPRSAAEDAHGGREGGGK